MPTSSPRPALPRTGRSLPPCGPGTLADTRGMIPADLALCDLLAFYTGPILPASTRFSVNPGFTGRNGRENIDKEPSLRPWRGRTEFYKGKALGGLHNPPMHNRPRQNQSHRPGKRASPGASTWRRITPLLDLAEVAVLGWQAAGGLTTPARIPFEQEYVPILLRRQCQNQEIQKHLEESANE